MKKDDLEQLSTKKDLYDLEERLKKVFLDYSKKLNPQREFYSPSEFSFMTSMKYQTVVYKCSTGRLKARQEAPNCAWQIDASELERYKAEASENL